MSNRASFNPNVAIDTDHAPVSGALAYFYDTGTTNAQTVYSDTALSVAHPQPLVADSAGMFADVFSADTTDLKIVVKTAAGATLYTIDPAIVQSTGGGASTVAFTPTSRISATDVQAAIEEVDADLAQLEKDVGTYYATAGSGNAYTVAVTGVTGYNAGDMYKIRADRANTGAVTLNIEGAGAKDWQNYDTAAALQAYTTGQIAAGSEFNVIYDGTRFVTLAVRYPIITSAELAAGTSTRPGTVAPVGVAAGIAALNPFGNALLHVRDEKTLGTAGGTFTLGDWRTRTLNTSKTNEITGASLATNQITLPAGTYYIDASAPAYRVGVSQAKLRNTTDGSDTLIGFSCNDGDASAAVVRAQVSGRFTIAAEKVFELQHKSSATETTNGFGVPASLATEVYADVKIWKVG